MSLFVDIRKNLGDFRLDVRFETEGGTLGLLGPSGCGKSLTLKCIAGIERPDSGRIILDGETLFDSERGINLPPQQRHVGYLFQNYALFPNMTVRKNVLCGLHAQKDKAVRERECREMLRLLQLEELADHKPHQLSGGQAQRTALARIMVSRPRLLLLDEPFSALDSHLRDKLQIELRELLKGFGREVILVTHSRDEAYHMCSHVAVVNEGRVVAHRATKALFADPGNAAAAAITGCKNIVEAVKSGEYEVTVPSWGGISFETRERVGDDLCAIGIRAHYFNPTAPKNRFRVRFVGEMEEPFETILLFRGEQQSDESEDIWWRISKDKRPPTLPDELGIAPANILLLY